MGPSHEPLYSRLAGKAVEAFYRGTATAAGLTPLARPGLHDVERFKDIAYRPSGRRPHHLDIYRLRDQTESAPVIFYIHGGGFRFLSKETHWLMGLAFARRGYLVVSINYRLAPRYPFPSAIVDACHAYQWTVDHIADYGGDPERISVAGESAGANLAATLSLAACRPFPQAWMRRVYDIGRPPQTAILACGIFQVSEPERFRRRFDLPEWLYHRLAEVGRDYLGPSRFHARQPSALADPLVLLEGSPKLHRPFPRTFAPVGTADPLIDDTRRLHRAFQHLDIPIEARYYPGEAHAFHAFLWRAQARQCWRDLYAFLDQYFPLNPHAPP